MSHAVCDTLRHAQAVTEVSARRTGEPRLAAVASWLVLGASFGLSAATWVALGRLAGFEGQAEALGVALSLAWLMPVAVDGYVVVALLLWMAPVPARVARFARANTYAAAGVGVVAQSAYHALIVYSASGSEWRLVWRRLSAHFRPLWRPWRCICGRCWCASPRLLRRS